MKTRLFDNKLKTKKSEITNRLVGRRLRGFFVVAMLAALAGVSLSWVPLQPVLAQSNTWTTKAPMQTASQLLAAAEIGGKLYAVGGRGGPLYNKLEVYNPATDTWETKTPMPTAREQIGAAAINGKLYVVGGIAGVALNKLEVYDPATDTWETKANMPIASQGLAVGVINGKLYAVGGGNNTISGIWLKTLQVYDPATNTWETKASMSTARFLVGAAAINGKLYVVGGYDGSILNSMEVYDPATDTWETKANMPTARYSLGVAAIDNKLYAVGGLSSFFLNKLEVYDPATDTWETKANMPTARSYLAAAAINGKLYAVGGFNNIIGTMNKLEVYEAVIPNTAPVASCQNVTVTAGADCTATITAAQVNNGSSDPDAGDSITLSLDSTGPFDIGQYTVILTATDSHGASNSCSATVTVVDTAPPALSCPDNVVAYLPPNSTDTSVAVNYPTPTASDCSNVTINASPASGSIFPVGTTTVNVTATDAAGNSSACSFTVTVLYNFIGFFQPVDNQPMVNVATAGSAVPVKFSLSGYKGLAIMAAGYPASQPINCSGGVQEVIEETVTAGASSLSYDATTDTYIYIWKTERSWRGTCRQLVVRLNDGTTHTPSFQFR